MPITDCYPTYLLKNKNNHNTIHINIYIPPPTLPHKNTHIPSSSLPHTPHIPIHWSHNSLRTLPIKTFFFLLLLLYYYYYYHYHHHYHHYHYYYYYYQQLTIIITIIIIIIIIILTLYHSGSLWINFGSLFLITLDHFRSP